MAYKLTPEELRSFYDELSDTRATYRRKEAKDIDSTAYRALATRLNDRRESYERELENGNARVGKVAAQAIEKMNRGIGSLANEHRHLASLLDKFKNSDKSRSDKAYDQALETHKRRLEAVERLITELMAKVKAAGEALSRPGGSGIRNLPGQHGGHYWPNARAAGAEYPW